MDRPRSEAGEEEELKTKHAEALKACISDIKAALSVVAVGLVELSGTEDAESLQAHLTAREQAEYMLRVEEGV